MLGRLELRREDEADDPLLIDQERDPSREETERLGDAIPSADGPIVVAQEQKRQSKPFGELLVRFAGIAADADHLGTGVAKSRMAVAERTGFASAAGRVVLGIEEQDHLGPAFEIGKGDHLPVRGRQGEVRGGVTGLKLVRLRHQGQNQRWFLGALS